MDYVSAGSEPKLTDVAKCTVTRAKPKADISWIYDSPSKFRTFSKFSTMFPTYTSMFPTYTFMFPTWNSIKFELKLICLDLQPEDVKTFDKPDANNKVVQTTSILQLIPEKKYNGQVVKCQVNHPELGKAIV